MLAGWRQAYANIALTGSNLIFRLVALNSSSPACISLAAALAGITRLFAR
jgi:hypothetical protein